jgi:imidazolonepropionase-like amidohydrolase
MIHTVRASRMFDGERFVRDPVVTFEDGTILDVGGPALPGAHVVDMDDATLLPGLIDAHQHLVFDGNGSLEEQVVDATDDELRERARLHARRALDAGITTIRDLGDRNFVTLDLCGDPELPTILASGPPLTAQGGHCWFLNGCCADSNALVAAVRERKRRGCAVVKIMVTGGALTPTYPMWASQFTTDDVALVVSTAHALGLPVAAHCHGIDGLVQAVDAGVDTIEHCTFFTESGRSEPDDALIERIAASGIAVSATMGVLLGHTPPPVVAANFERVLDAMRRLRENGATVVVGTDAGISAGKPHDVLPHAAVHLAAIGLAPAEVLATMTAVAADVCGLTGRKGRLAPGHDADILAVQGDPSIDPDSLLAVRGVWRGGRPARTG